MKKFLITDLQEIEKIITNAKVCSLAMISENKPYCVPMNFGYDDGIIYLHGAPEGKKFNALKENPDVCISFYTDEALNIVHENVACSYSMKYKSVVASGSVVFVDEIEEKVRILNIIMKNYSGRDNFTYSKPALQNVSVFYLKPNELTAYKRGY
ncbi:MAG TPA: pyridoxamine 5'-phosphate oxidase family protein [Bacteroidales bacterium]|nr:pyridoxamine 5'-phosphate oxidase family protein [Bacteroidales bacterium]